MTLKVLDLFSGIGGFSLGLERTGGFETVAFCEIEPYCRRVLAKHWPKVPCYEDIRTLTAETLYRDRIRLDFITGGFPCQDISVAGNQEGIEGEQSGLWEEYKRLICELRPRGALLENVSNLLVGGNGEWFGKVLGDLAALGYDTEWHCIPASYLGAPHIRDRVWVFAYSNKNGWKDGLQLERKLREKKQSCVWDSFRAVDFRLRVQELAKICRNDDGIPEELDAYGNSVVPQIPELIGRAILEYENA